MTVRALTVSIAVLALTGCRFLPSTPWNSTYVTMSGESMVARSRCTDALVSVTVQWLADGHNTPAPDLWSAEVEREPLPELVILRPGQRGVRVTSNQTPPESFAGQLVVIVSGTDGLMPGVSFSPGSLAPGMVVWDGGVSPEADFWAMDPREFGWCAP